MQIAPQYAAEHAAQLLLIAQHTSAIAKRKERAMFKDIAIDPVSYLYPAQDATTFHSADVLYALAWASLAPGIDGWRISLPDAAHTSVVFVIPPGSDEPVFFIRRKGGETVVQRQAKPGTDWMRTEVGRFDGLRTAIRALCPLDDEKLEELNTRMEVIYPRSVRELRLAVVS
jgi:hypothetical protein